MSKGKPVILTDYKDDAELADEYDFDRAFGVDDPSYIPKYSEIVQANDIAKAPDLQFRVQHEQTGITKEKMYEVIGARPQDLPVNFRWLRVTAPNGGNSYNADSERMHFTERVGYRLATKDDLERYGFGFPPAAHPAADGTIRRLDTALFVVDGRRERAYEKWLAEQTAKAENAIEREGKDSGVRITSEAERETLTVTTKD